MHLRVLDEVNVLAGMHGHVHVCKPFPDRGCGAAPPGMAHPVHEGNAAWLLQQLLILAALVLRERTHVVVLAKHLREGGELLLHTSPPQMSFHWNTAYFFCGGEIGTRYAHKSSVSASWRWSRKE